MNELERKMVQQLQDLRENHHVIGVKAEFEAEGTRLEEAIRLKEVISAAGLGLTMKVGGCEAVRDMYEARVIGVDRVVGPMVESPWALHKFVQAVKMAFPEEERDQVQFCVNIETVTGVKNFDAMVKLPDVEELDGIVLGRVDMCGSLGLTREDINQPQVLEIAVDAIDIRAVRPFWKAVLGYDDDRAAAGDVEPALADPAGIGPSVWFQQMDVPRPQRNRIHLDVTVPHDVAEQRVAAAIAAAGRLVSDRRAPSFWVLADAEGNEACVSTWQGRD